jgi:hypothetical protein
MDLAGLAGPLVGSVLPQMLVTVRISTGPGQAAPDGTRTPGYASPGSITASIAGNVLTVSAVAPGTVLQPGQSIAGAGVAGQTVITQQLGGTPGGAGTYGVSINQNVGSEAMTTFYVLFGSVQPVGWRDTQQMEGLNLGGVRYKVYLHGEVDALVRSEKKGGDLVIIPSGPHAGTWLVAMILEQFPDWCCAAITLQNGG